MGKARFCLRESLKVVFLNFETPGKRIALFVNRDLGKAVMLLIPTEIVVMVTMALTLLVIAGVWSVAVPDVVRVNARRGEHRINPREI